MLAVGMRYVEFCVRWRDGKSEQDQVSIVINSEMDIKSSASAGLSQGSFCMGELSLGNEPAQSRTNKADCLLAGGWRTKSGVGAEGATSLIWHEDWMLMREPTVNARE